jgi:hypothetical protein
MYNLVIRLVLTYDSTVWWPRVTYRFSRTELSKLQRSAGLAVTEVMRITPTATKGFLPGNSYS